METSAELMTFSSITRMNSDHIYILWNTALVEALLH